MYPLLIWGNDDCHMLAKHSLVYPTQEELERVQNVVAYTEWTFKAVSNWTDEQK